MSHSNYVARIMKECGKEGCHALLALLPFKPVITMERVSVPKYRLHSPRHLGLSCFVKTNHLPHLFACSLSHSPFRFHHRKRKNGAGLLLVTLDPFPRLFHLSMASGLGKKSLEPQTVTLASLYCAFEVSDCVKVIELACSLFVLDLVCFADSVFLCLKVLRTAPSMLRRLSVDARRRTNVVRCKSRGSLYERYRAIYDGSYLIERTFKCIESNWEKNPAIGSICIYPMLKRSWMC